MTGERLAQNSVGGRATCGESVIGRYRKEENEIVAARLCCRQATADISSPVGSGDVQIVGESKLKSAEIALSRVPSPWENRGRKLATQATKAKGGDGRNGRKGRGDGRRKLLELIAVRVWPTRVRRSCENPVSERDQLKIIATIAFFGRSLAA